MTEQQVKMVRELGAEKPGIWLSRREATEVRRIAGLDERLVLVFEVGLWLERVYHRVKAMQRTGARRSIGGRI